MIITEWPELAESYLLRLRQMVIGERVMHSVQYGERGDEFHLSEFQLCPLPGYYRRTMQTLPPLDDSSILRFFRGRIIERAIATEAEPKERDEIWCTVDDIHPEFGIVEIKSTAKGSQYFDVEKEQPDWIERMGGYCHVYGATCQGLVVFFLIGNASDFLPWARRNKGEKIKYKGIDFKAWKIEFTPEELEKNWAEMVRRKETLTQWLAGMSIDDDEVNSRRPEWMCKVCQYSELCFWNTKKELTKG